MECFKGHSFLPLRHKDTGKQTSGNEAGAFTDYADYVLAGLVFSAIPFLEASFCERPGLIRRVPSKRTPFGKLAKTVFY